MGSPNRDLSSLRSREGSILICQPASRRREARTAASAPRMPGRKGYGGWLFGVQTRSHTPVVMQFAELARWSPPFTNPASLQELRALLEALPGVTWVQHEYYPMTTLLDLARPGTLDLFLAVLEWAMGEIGRAAQEGTARTHA